MQPWLNLQSDGNRISRDDNIFLSNWGAKTFYLHQFSPIQFQQFRTVKVTGLSKQQGDKPGSDYPH
jgi:hypothetical protein